VRIWTNPLLENPPFTGVNPHSEFGPTFSKGWVKQKNSPCKKQAIYKKSEMLFSLEDHNTKLKQQAIKHGVH
jgi:hypothetical protein